MNLLPDLVEYDETEGYRLEQDPTRLLNEGFRYRDPETGTFLTRDPLGFKAGPNMYTYVHQNPWTMFDPEGLDSSQPNPPPPKPPAASSTSPGQAPQPPPKSNTEQPKKQGDSQPAPTAKKTMAQIKKEIDDYVKSQKWTKQQQKDFYNVFDMLLSESANPTSTNKYSTDDSIKQMDALASVLINRLKTNPAAFGAPGAKDLSDMIYNKKFGEQWNGFDGKTGKESPKIVSNRSKLLQAVGDGNQQVTQFINQAAGVAKTAATGKPIPDPYASSGGTFGVRTQNSSSPGPAFQKVGTVGGQDFYTWKPN